MTQNCLLLLSDLSKDLTLCSQKVLASAAEADPNILEDSQGCSDEKKENDVTAGAVLIIGSKNIGEEAPEREALVVL